MTIKAELAQRLVDADPDRAKEELAQIQSLTREALAEIRATVAGLRVARLDDEIISAIAALADADVSGQLPADASVVDPRHRIVLAWVLREAATNVVRDTAERPAAPSASGRGPCRSPTTDGGAPAARRATACAAYVSGSRPRGAR